MMFCLVDNCAKEAFRRGYCPGHYWRLREHGDPLGGGTYRYEAREFFETTVLSYDGDDCLVWPYTTNSAGYARLRADGEMQLVSRLVCTEVYGPPPTQDHEAAHSCGRGHLGCVAKRHLSWKTHIDNEADKVIHGTSPRGERNGGAKLQPSDVLEIRALRGKLTLQEIGDRFGVSFRTVSQIHLRQRWGWLPDREEAA